MHGQKNIKFSETRVVANSWKHDTDLNSYKNPAPTSHKTKYMSI